MWKLKSIEPSNKPTKKWSAIFYDSETENYKTVSFGASGYRDYTLIYPLDKEEAEKARIQYWRRHAKDLKTNNPISPGYLSLFILWGKHPSVEKNMKWYKRMFNL